MRKAMYEGLVRLPLKMGGGGIAVAGFIGTVWPERIRSIVDNGVSAQSVQTLGAALLALATIYFCALWLLKPSDSPSGEGGGGLNQKTGGSGSHNFANVAGGVHIHNAPAPTQERKNPYGSQRPSDNSPLTRMERLNDGLHSALTGRAGENADLRFEAVLGRLYKILGPAPKDDTSRLEAFYKKIDRELGDAAHLHGLDVWGRIDENPLSKIWLTHTIQFDHRRKVASTQSDQVRRTFYTDLRFNAAQVKRIWPSPG